MDMKKSGEALLKWHAQTERELPWKGETDAYRIWVSETMLQQTRAAVVAGRYAQFLREFPDVFALAAAQEEQVLSIWQGLGYYARARNLHKAAQQVVERHGGVFPADEKQLRALAGVGEYTACAVLSMAYGQPVAAVDANLARVISRVFGIYGCVEDNRPVLREKGTEWLKACAMDSPGDFNRALMGIGAMVCMAKRADCANCPLSAWCEAYANGEQDILPEKRPKNARKEEWHTVAIVLCDGKVLVRQRPEKGMLAKMWEFPHFLSGEEGSGPKTGEEGLAEEGFSARAVGGQIGASDFTFTHRIWHLCAWEYKMEETEMRMPYRLVDADELAALPVASVMEPYRQIALEKLGR